MTYEDFLSKLHGVRGKTALCPAHDDRQRSLSHKCENGKILLHCHAGCTTEDIVDALGLKVSDLFLDEPMRKSTMDIVAEYNYSDSSDKLVYQVVRSRPKSFRQRRPDGRGGWIWNMQGIKPLPYKLAGLLAALERGETVFIVEGEKDVDNLLVLGLTATCNHGGAGKWYESHSEYLPIGAEVVILPDNDEPGREHARKVANQLIDRGCRVKVVELPGLLEKGDVSDWFKAGHSKEEMLTLVDQATYWESGGGLKDKNTLEEPMLWQPPIPFNEYELPAFRYDILPSWLSDFVSAEAEASQTPMDLAGMLSLSVCAAAVAKKVVVLVRDGWVEPLNVFTVIALPPASRKSAVFASVQEPVIEYEEEFTRSMVPIIEDKKVQHRILEQTLSKVQTEAAKAKGQKREELIYEATAYARELAEMEIKESPRLVVDDCSPEKLAKLLSSQGGKLALLAPEGDVFDIMAGRYSSGTPNLGVYLRGHAGDTIRIDRVGRPPDYILNPALTVAACVQPDVLAGLIHKPSFRGRGLLGRFLYALPKPNIGHRKIGVPPLAKVIGMTYRQNIKKLFSLHCGVGEEGKAKPHYLRLSAEAEIILHDFERWLSPIWTKMDP